MQAAPELQHEDRDDRAEVDRAELQARAGGRSAGTGSCTSRRKSSTALSGREYGTRTPNEKTQDTMIEAKMISV